jgi:hypothetical protein
VAGEFAENEFRKQFTPSERTAIGAAIENEMGKRHGGDRRSSHANAGFDKGETVDLAARRAGFQSAETFERAKAVVERGAPEVIAAMDAGEGIDQCRRRSSPNLQSSLGRVNFASEPGLDASPTRPAKSCGIAVDFIER